MQPCSRVPVAPLLLLLLSPLGRADDVLGMKEQVLMVDVVESPSANSTMPSENTTMPVVRVGVAAHLGLNNKFKFMERHLIKAYGLFFDWLNKYRGGIYIDGVAHVAELTIASDSNDVPNLAFEHLVSEGVRLILSPYGSGVVQPFVERVNLSDVVMISATASETEIFAGSNRTFGISSPSVAYLEPGLTLLGPKVQSLVAIREGDDPFTTSVCSVVPTAAAEFGLQYIDTIEVSREPNASLGQFSPQEVVSQLKNHDADLVIGCLISEDICLELVMQMQAQNYSPKAVLSTICAVLDGFDEALGYAANWMLGVTPWIPDSATASALNNWSAQDYAYHFERHYDEEPSYQGAAAWAACEVLVNAIETAGSADPELVAQALVDMDLETVFGRIRFDAIGQSTVPLKVVQRTAAGKFGLHTVYPLTVATRALEFPMPPWDDRKCYAETPATSVYGYSGDTCGDCYLSSPSQVAIFNSTSGKRVCEPCAANSRAVLEIQEDEEGQVVLLASCIIYCDDGKVAVAGTCQDCTPGKYQENLDCASCSVGTYAPSYGATSCSQCDAGSFAHASGASICKHCPLGKSTANSVACNSCPVGFFRNQQSQTACTLCPEGRVAPLSGSTNCTICDAGFISLWGSIRCDPCPVGSYSPQPERASCIAVTPGLQAPFKNMTRPWNQPRFWVAGIPEIGDEQQGFRTELCRYYPKSCLEDERCKEGFTGNLCFACLPGYARSKGSGCFYCTTWALHFVMTLIVIVMATAVNLVYVYLVSKVANKPTAYHTVVLKQWVNHMVLMSVTRELFSLMLAETEERSPMSKETRDFANNVAMLFDWGDGSIMPSESVVWSMTCVTERSIAASLAEFSTRLQLAKHSEYYTAPFREAREAFREHAFRSELVFTMLWTVWPAVLITCISLFGAMLLLRDLYLNSEDYHEALQFYREVHLTTFARASKQVISSRWRDHVKLYYRRLFAIYWPVRHARSFLEYGFFDILYWWQECRAMRVVVLFLAFPGTIRGIMRGFTCVRLQEGARPVLLARSEVECTFDVVIVPVCCALLWCVMYPTWAFFHLRLLFNERLRGAATEEHLKSATFMYNGYKAEFWWWEVVLILRKVVIVLTVVLPLYHWHETGRALFFLLAAIFFFLLDKICDPYDHRGDSILRSIERQSLVTWIAVSIIIKVCVLAEEEAILRISPVLILILHLLFFARIIGALYIPFLVFLGSMLPAVKRASETEEDHSDVPPTFRQRVARHILDYPQQMALQQPYITLDPLYGWVTVVGTGGRKGPVPYFPRGMVDKVSKEGMSRLSKEVEVRGVEPPHERDVIRVQQALDDTARYILVDRRDTYNAVFSCCLYEFLIRGAFLVNGAREGADPVEAEEATLAIWKEANLRHDPLHLQRHAKVELILNAESAQAMGKQDKAHHDDQIEYWGNFMEEQLRKETLSVLMSTMQLQEERRRMQYDPDAVEMERAHRQRLQDERLHRAVEAMFTQGPYRHNLTIQELEMALMLLQRTTHKELITWLNLFERRWLRMHSSNKRSLRPYSASRDWGTEIEHEEEDEEAKDEEAQNHKPGPRATLEWSVDHDRIMTKGRWYLRWQVLALRLATAQGNISARALELTPRWREHTTLLTAAVRRRGNKVKELREQRNQTHHLHTQQRKQRHEAEVDAHRLATTLGNLEDSGALQDEPHAAGSTELPDEDHERHAVGSMVLADEVRPHPKAKSRLSSPRLTTSAI